MDKTETEHAEGVDVTAETPQTMKVLTVTVSYDHFIEGKESNTGTVEIPVTEEILAAVKATCAPEFNITVTQ